MSRIVHPVSTSRCYNKLPVVLRLPQHLAADTVLNFSASATYFLDPGFATAVADRFRGSLLSPLPRDLPKAPGMDRRDP